MRVESEVENDLIAVEPESFAPGKNSDFPEVPSVLDFASSERDKEAIKLAFADQEMGNPFIGPTGLSGETATLLKEAFARTMQDPQFIADAKASGVEIDWIPGDSVRQIVDAAYSSTAAQIERAKALVAN